MDDIPFVIKIPQDYQSLKTLYNKRENNQISVINQRIRDFYHVSLDKENKKKLKIFFLLILQYLDDVQYYHINEYLRNNCRHYIELGILFPDSLNTFFKEKFISFEKLINVKHDFNNKLMNFIQYSVVLCYLSLNADLTNQFNFNYTVILTQIIKKIQPNNTINLLIKIVLLGNMIMMEKYSNLFNPFIMNTLEVILLKLLEIENIPHGEGTNLINQFFPAGTNINISLVIQRIIELTIRNLSEIANILKNEINYDTIFHNILSICLNLLKSESECIIPHKSRIHTIVKSLQLNIERSKSKKSTHINFFIEKKKEIDSLNPEIDPEYDFSLTWGEKKNLLKKKTQNNIIKKVKKTKREAIRNLKKESRLIDMERQKERSKMDQKRKEEIKLSNQFIEQTNMEYKKLRTSQTKKKEKKRREIRKAGNQV